MKNIKTFFLVIFLMSLTAVQSFARVAYMQDNKASYQKSSRPDIIRELNLSNRQIREFELLKDEFRKKQIRHNAILKERHIDLNAEIRKNNPNEKEINNLIGAISRIRARILKERVEHALAIRSILNNEQKQKLRDFPLWHEKSDNYRYNEKKDNRQDNRRQPNVSRNR